ncbi:MAG: type I DNA topoisomerase [Nitrospirae bacterium]|nr:type I DNA topoisomerase [Nitrospirota bacterium]
MKSLVIVESPAKARTINKILGNEFRVLASIGHVKDLPEKEMGVDIENDFKPHYIVIPGKEKVIKELKKVSKEADRIFLAPDPDREGEAIAWHIVSEISDLKSRVPDERIYRITFNEITERAVREAIKTPNKIDMKKVEAQQARRILDRLVGYCLSPLLWRKVKGGLSAGRVQSVAVRLIVDRERGIETFKKEEYWSINAEFEGSKKPSFWARLHSIEHRAQSTEHKFLIPNEEIATAIVNDLRDKEFVLSKIERKQRKKMPYPPFITSTLQQEAARKLRFPAKKTMAVAQQLYEGIELGGEGAVGLITYMRTDSHRIAPEAQEWARELIDKTFGKDYVPEKPPQYKSKATAQEAHEAIRPTYPTKRPEDIRQFLSKDQQALYTLIWNCFISSQMSPAQLEQTTFIIESEVRSQNSELQTLNSELNINSSLAEFRASGTVIRFPGFMALYTESKDEVEDENGLTLPPLKEGERLRLLNLQPRQHFTQPPPRYTEAALVKALEEKGIGRPSTYATILSTIQDRKYVHKIDGKFFPTELGTVVNGFLVERFPELIDIGFTAKLEGELDHIEDGKRKWVKVVRDFYNPFSHDLTEAIKTTGKIKPKDIPTETMCEKCGLPMVLRWGRHGRFIACSGFPKCKNTKPIKPDSTEQRAESTPSLTLPPRGGGQGWGVDSELRTLNSELNCEKCGSPMILKSGKYGKFLACSRYPECRNTKPIATGVKCPQDSGDIVERRSRKGKPFWSCSNYPECKFALWYRPVNKKCPQCSAEFIVEKRDRTGKIYLSCLKKGCGYKEDSKEVVV